MDSLHRIDEKCIQYFGRATWRENNTDEGNVNIDFKGLKCEGADWI
jgi:hypothetical protein